MNEFPLVSCLCLTRNRREWLPQAIECFLQQEYAPRELLIIADKKEDVVGLVPNYPGYIRVFLHPGVVGVKRNVGCQEAKGEVIAICDDDDYSAPGRLANQIQQLKTSGKAVTGYHTMKFTDGKKWFQYRGASNTVIATSLCFTKEFWRSKHFLEMNCGQDEDFATVAAARKQIAPLPDTDLMYATIHPANTSPREPGRNAAFVPLENFKWAS